LSTLQIIAAVSGALIIAVTIWQIRKRGIPEDNGRIDENWTSGA
jgi:hypothetical protein